MRPRLLDLFSGAGGCSVGYHRAGFDVTGVDIENHPDYPYTLHVRDSLEVLADRDYLNTFDVVHASPPCQGFTTMSNRHRGQGGKADQHSNHIPESSIPLWPLPSRPVKNPVGVYGKHHDGRRLFTRTDGTNQRAAASLEEARAAMGIDWMNWRDLCEAIPPAYTEHIGRQLLAALDETRAA